MLGLGNWHPGVAILSADIMQALWHPYDVSALDGRRIPNIWFEVRS
jgi:hypothetical protein